MGASVGIDLGTTNSVCGYTPNGQNPRVLANRERNALTPSVVARHRDGTLLVGNTAKRAAKADPLNVIFSIKRLMGRRFQDKEVAIVQQHVPYRVVAGPDGMVCVMIGEKRYSPIEVSALILKKIKEDASAALGQEVTHAVITVPAYFDDTQREATRQAGGLAGLKVKRIIDEPTAAAYAFGVDLEAGDSRAIVVYDLGGGTFDVSVIFIGSGVPTVENIGGDIWLGGDRFDNAIIDHILRKYPQYADELRKDPAFMLELKTNSEAAKLELAGGAPASDIAVTGALKGKVDVEVTIRGEEFNRMIQDDIRRSLDLVVETLKGADMSADDVTNVLLVGGSTGLPMVTDMLTAKFGKEKIRCTVNPMECVALGAAILASRSEKKFCPKKKCPHPENEPDAAKCAGCGAELTEEAARVQCPHCRELHARDEVVCPNTGRSLVGEPEAVTAKPFGIAMGDGRFEIVVPKGTRYPTSEPLFHEFETEVDDQKLIVIPVYQGTDSLAARNELQGKIVAPIPVDKRVPRGTPFVVGFEINEFGVLTVRVEGKGRLSWLKAGRVVRPWEEDPWEDQNLTFWSKFAEVAIQDLGWCLPTAGMYEISKLVMSASRQDSVPLLTKQLQAAMKQYAEEVKDLAEAAFVQRYGDGDLDRRERLERLLWDLRRRVIQGENPYLSALWALREEIRVLTREIVEGTSQVPCRRCGEMRPRPTVEARECEHCGHDAYWSERQ